MQTAVMLALFSDDEARDKAFEAVKDVVNVVLLGDANLVVGAKKGDSSSSFIVFKGSMMDALKFMQHGSSATVPL